MQGGRRVEDLVQFVSHPFHSRDETEGGVVGDDVEAIALPARPGPPDTES